MHGIRSYLSPVALAAAVPCCVAETHPVERVKAGAVVCACSGWCVCVRDVLGMCWGCVGDVVHVLRMCCGCVCVGDVVCVGDIM